MYSIDDDQITAVIDEVVIPAMLEVMHAVADADSDPAYICDVMEDMVDLIRVTLTGAAE